MATCPVCDAPIVQSGRGRRRVFCSDRCSCAQRSRRHRARQGLAVLERTAAELRAPERPVWFGGSDPVVLAEMYERAALATKAMLA